MNRRGVDELVGPAMSLVAIFATSSEVVLRNNDENQFRVDIVRICQEQLLKLSSKSTDGVTSKAPRWSILSS